MKYFAIIKALLLLLYLINISQAKEIPIIIRKFSIDYDNWLHTKKSKFNLIDVGQPISIYKLISIHQDHKISTYFLKIKLNRYLNHFHIYVKHKSYFNRNLKTRSNLKKVQNYIYMDNAIVKPICNLLDINLLIKLVKNYRLVLFHFNNEFKCRINDSYKRIELANDFNTPLNVPLKIKRIKFLGNNLVKHEMILVNFFKKWEKGKNKSE